MTINQQIEMTRGDSRRWAFQVLDENQAPVSLAVHGGLRFTAKRSIADPDASSIFQKTLASGVASGGGFVVASATLGYATVQLAPLDTSALEDAIVQLSYDIQMVDANANKYTIVAGRLTVRPDVTLS